MGCWPIKPIVRGYLEYLMVNVNQHMIERYNNDHDIKGTVTVVRKTDDKQK